MCPDLTSEIWSSCPEHSIQRFLVNKKKCFSSFSSNGTYICSESLRKTELSIKVLGCHKRKTDSPQTQDSNWVTSGEDALGVTHS